MNKGSMSFMTNYIGELEKLIIDDDVEKPKKKGNSPNNLSTSLNSIRLKTTTMFQASPMPVGH